MYTTINQRITAKDRLLWVESVFGNRNTHKVYVSVAVEAAARWGTVQQQRHEAINETGYETYVSYPVWILNTFMDRFSPKTCLIAGNITI